GFLGLTITGSVTYYKYGLNSEYNCQSSLGTGTGHMLGSGGMMNMMSSFWFSNENTSLENYSFIEVKERTENYLEENNLEDLQIVEIMEFSENFYIEIVERDTNIGAIELLLDKKTGEVFPEYGPNMMWNTKYGMHTIINSNTDMSIKREEAIQLGEKYLISRGTDEFIGEEADEYYGYYTIHTVTRDGDIAGMLSVNGVTGQVWYHNWHGIFINMEEYEIH
ncbi:MAG: hypothetical protein ABUK08_07285, partial [Candidatus Humimicrobiaceae bacterium]